MKKLLANILSIFVVAQAWAVDTYNPTNGQLTIPTVVVGDTAYSNVVVKVDQVFAVNGGDLNRDNDIFNTNNGRLNIASVKTSNVVYNNVTVSIKEVLSIGGKVYVNPIISNAGTWTPVADKNFITNTYNGTIAGAYHGLIKLGSSYGVVVTGWGMSGWPPTLTQTAPISLGIFKSDTSGNLALSTDSYISDPVTSGGGSVIVADFNGDGKDDIFLAAHNESPFIAMPSTAYLSTSSDKFIKVKLNDKVMAHSAVLVNLNGRPTVVTAEPGQDGKSPIYFYKDNDFTQIDTGLSKILGTMSATVVNSGKFGYQYVIGGVFAWDPIAQKRIYQNIQVFTFDPINFKIASTKPIKNITPYLTSLGIYKDFPANIGGPGLTHTYRVYAHDINHDGLEDVLAEQSMWSTTNNAFPVAYQILINNGDGTFTDKTQTLNPDMDLNTAELDYHPSFIDLDNSGIKTILHAGIFDYWDKYRHSNYVLLNDGTGRLYVALHNEFLEMAKNVYKFKSSLSDYAKSLTPRFIGVPQSDGSVNFLAELYTSDNKTVHQSVDYVNVPVRYNPKTDFTQNITVSDRNNSMKMRTWAGNDVFYDTNANSNTTKIDGGLGTNKVIYSGSSAQYSVSRNTNGTTSVVSSSSAPIQINDTLTNIQQIQFIDKTLALN